MTNPIGWWNKRFGRNRPDPSDEATRKVRGELAEKIIELEQESRLLDLMAKMIAERNSDDEETPR